MKFGLNSSVHDENVFGYTQQRCHVSPLWEDQCDLMLTDVLIDELMLSCPPHVQRVEGEEEDSGMGGEAGGRGTLNGCNANGIRGHGNQFTLLKQMRAARPCHRERSRPFFLFWPPWLLL